MNTLNDRQNTEIELINRFNFLSIKQLAAKLNVSEMTVRRDVNLLSSSNLVQQVYGGVASIKSKESDTKYAFSQELTKNKIVKDRITNKALELLNDNDVIFLDSGTTVQSFVEKFSEDSTYTLISSSFNTLDIIVKLPLCTVITPGGVYSKKPNMFYNPSSEEFFQKYRANKCFIGATGFDIDLGLTCSYLEDAPIKQAMIEASQEKILLIDSSKFNKVSTCMFAKVDTFSTIITDEGIPDDYREYILSMDIELIIV